jgi:uncharacterized protein
MRRFALLPLAALFVAAGSLSIIAQSPAAAQGGMFSPSYRFLEAVRERNGEEVNQLLNGANGAILINTRDVTTGRTALHVVIERRDLTWLNFLLQRGADPRIADRAGITPLRQTTEIGFLDGARALLARGANVNQTNNRGETALHIAVQRRDVAMTRLLVEAGADAELTDSVTGRSARDYATQDPRGSAVVAALNSARPSRPATPVTGPN